ncbi:MAG: hypothetical protein H7A55_00185 [Verrucomicrobiaceae bacterium]|nr:hypothetical protein [Verrucomicrobiaceae bacterium]
MKDIAINRRVGIALLLPWIITSLGSAEEIATPIPSDTHLLLDSRVIETVQNATLGLGSIQKHARNPLMGEDKPWEVRFDNLYANVIYDPGEKLYKCWYSPFIVDRSAKGMTLDQRHTNPYRPPPGRQMGVCYAVSADGLRWEKPALELVEFEGSKANNLVLRGPHGVGVLLDDQEADPQRRYKMFTTQAMRFSSDGLHWSPPESSSGILSRDDTHNNMLRVREGDHYAGFVRLWSDGWGKGQRVVGRTESKDLLQWSQATEVLRCDAQNQAYAMPVFRYANVYLGLLAVFRKAEDRVHTELAWSPDTVAWHRIQPGVPFIANSPTEGDYDWGCVYAAASPIVREKEIRLYCGGSNGRHTSWRDGFLCLATLRPDGWAGYTPTDPAKPAILTTRSVRCSGAELWITCDVQPGGSVKVTALDEVGHAVDSVTLTKTGTRLSAGRLVKSVNHLVSLRLEISLAKVYSFGFTSK